MQANVLEPNVRKSVVVTRPSDRQPWLDNTKITAFLREEVNSRAFQVPQQKSKEASIDKRLMAEMQVPGRRWFDQMIPPFKEPTELLPVGAEFSDGDTEVSAISWAKWDGKRLTIFFSIARSHDKTINSISAPLALAMSKPFIDTAKMASNYRSSRAAPLPLEGNAFQGSFIVERNAPVFVVEQPIILNSAGRRSCFLAASYSPVEIEPDAQSCDLFR